MAAAASRQSGYGHKTALSRGESMSGYYQRLQQLEPRRQQAFMAALCERLLPNYALYAQTAGHGNPRALRAILDLVWERLSVKEARIDFALQAEKLAELAPGEEDDSRSEERRVGKEGRDRGARDDYKRKRA